MTKREQLKAMLLKEFEEDQTPEEFHANEMAMKAFGLLPAIPRSEGAAGPGLFRGDRRFLRPEDQDHAPDRGARGQDEGQAHASWNGSSASRAASTRMRTRRSSPTN